MLDASDALSSSRPLLPHSKKSERHHPAMANQINPGLAAQFADRENAPAGGSSAEVPLPQRLRSASFLAACGSNNTPATSSTSATAAADDGAPATGNLRISNWPLYMADGFVAAFQTAVRADRGLQGRLQRQRGVVRQEQGAAVAQAGHRRRPGGADPVHGAAAQGPRLAQRDQRHPRAEQEEPAARPAERPVRSRPQVHRALHVRHDGPGLQQGRDRSGHHQDRRPVGSGVQGQGQPAVRHAGRPRHGDAVAGQLDREPHHRRRPEGRRPGQGTEGQGPDPAVHRQRLRRRPRGGQHRHRAGVLR